MHLTDDLARSLTGEVLSAGLEARLCVSQDSRRSIIQKDAPAFSHLDLVLTTAWLCRAAIRASVILGLSIVLIFAANLQAGEFAAQRELVAALGHLTNAPIMYPVEGFVADNPKGWKRHEWAGPRRVGIYGDSDAALADQWMYHAVADTVLANSLLRSLPEVDAAKVGVMGISWGGVITSTVIGIDPRFDFAIPTYGCWHLFDAAKQYGRALGNSELYQQVWDPMVRMNLVKMPVMWFSWPQDQHFPMDCLTACYHAAPGPRLVTLHPGMGHGHGAGWNAPDSYAFAESIVAEGKPWCRQTIAATADNVAQAEFTSTKPLESALLVSTTDTGVTVDRKWIESPATLEQSGHVWRCAAPLPAGTTAWFINVRSCKLTASSDYQEKRRLP